MAACSGGAQRGSDAGQAGDADFFTQIVIAFRRSMRKWTRNWQQRLMDAVLNVAMALIIGGISGTNWNITAV
eukprot:CAMPEP_0117676672 /NCGR_PEP_ID=MMETSP0804-20121206/16321_1 /TAXON_ID=1074897 /ORGANISM="Tetraselmis astigmatica, Strain CCMP880" /LENGTH=71 /DNA_ID=CAMNT_0005485873 /DNA_START=356 /DNA_END=568 /DNA_ORIENTATION=+